MTAQRQLQRKREKEKKSILGSYLDLITFASVRKKTFCTTNRLKSGELKMKFDQQIPPIHKRLIQFLSFQFICCSIELTSDLEERHSNRFSSPDTATSGLKNNIVLSCLGGGAKRLTIHSLFLLIGTKISYDLWCDCALLFYHDKSMHTLRDEVSKSRTGGKLLRFDCALWSNLSKSYQDHFNRSEKLAAEVEEAGVLARSSIGTYFTSLSIISTSLVIFYIWPTVYLSVNKAIRSDNLASILQPAATLQLMWNRLEHIISDLYGEHLSSEKPSTCAKTSLDSGLSSLAGLHHVIFKPYQRFSLRKSHSHMMRMEERARFLQLIGSLGTKCHPSVATVEWRIDLIKSSSILMSAFIITSWSGPILSVGTLSFLEVWQHSEQRLAEIRCRHLYGPQAILAHPIVLALRQLTPDDEQEYHDYYKSLLENEHNYSILSRLYLIFGVEMRYFANFRTVMHVIELNICMFFLAIWSSFWFFLYILDFFHGTTLLLQVRHQLKQCIRGLAAYNSAAEENYSSVEQTSIEQQLVVAYIGYEFFRRQFKHTHRMTHFLVMQGAMLTTGTFFALYLVGSNFDANKKGYLVFIAICVYAFMNFYLFSASLMPKLVEEIMFQIIQLLAYNNHPHPTRPINASVFKIWYKQLMDERDIEHFSAATLFGYHISYRQLVSLNVNLLLLLLLLLRAYSHLATATGSSGSSSGFGQPPPQREHLLT